MWTLVPMNKKKSLLHVRYRPISVWDSDVPSVLCVSWDVYVPSARNDAKIQVNYNFHNMLIVLTNHTLLLNMSSIFGIIF